MGRNLLSQNKEKKKKKNFNNSSYHQCKKQTSTRPEFLKAKTVKRTTVKDGCTKNK